MGHTPTLGTPARPLRVAIVGSGPSGFYTAEALFKSPAHACVDLFDRLPTPYGLVRGGVAPDHPKIRHVSRVFDRIASHDGFAFLGNVTVGRDIALDELARCYDAVCLACGGERDRRLGIPGEDLPGSHAATEFVGWYNGHQDFSGLTFDLSHVTAVVVGQGNVAMDLARILLKPVDELRHTDMAEHALDTLAESRVREVYIIGRRGPVQAKFTPPELREIGAIPSCATSVIPGDLVLNDASKEELASPHNRHAQMNMEALRRLTEPQSEGDARHCHIRFLRSPLAIEGDGRVERVVLGHNTLTGPAFGQCAEPLGDREELDCGLVLRSLGFQADPFPGVPFDAEAGVVPNERGRVIDANRPVPGCYVAGWMKRGASGVIGNNKPDARETVAAILEDMPSLPPCAEPDTGAVYALLRQRGVTPVSFADWKRLDEEEVARGEAKGKPRKRFVAVDEMLRFLGKAP